LVDLRVLILASITDPMHAWVKASPFGHRARVMHDFVQVDRALGLPPRVEASLRYQLGRDALEQDGDHLKLAVWSPTDPRIPRPACASVATMLEPFASDAVQERAST